MSVDDQMQEGNVAEPSKLAMMADHVRQLLGASVTHCELSKGQIVVRAESDQIAAVVKSLRDDRHAAFNQLSDLTAVDYPERPERFEMVYQFLSMTNNMRLRLLVAVGDGQAVASITDLYSSANWAEREVWDMFGIFFSSHPDLRRLLTDYGFEGHPLRKDFPLTGHVEVRYDDTLRRVVNEPVQLVQEFRDFDFLSPWEGMQVQIDAGDEKSSGKSGE
ncbi:NADH-quinone oxidoreductase subunit C [Alphaproteobacteria bacterium]|nr:NADH-quinone oxidoreductase subunit C [Alphaproteobacteria bacterium]